MKRANTKYGGNTLSKVLLGFILALLLIPICGFAYLKFGRPPVAVADTPFPYEKQIVKIPLNARIDREMLKSAPFGTSEDVFESGARIYHEQCSACHGDLGADSDFGAHMYPSAPQLWRKHRRGNVVGVSDDDVGETYWKVANGIRLTGMSSFEHTLSTTQMWDVSLLLKNADQPLPDPVTAILKQPLK